MGGIFLDTGKSIWIQKSSRVVKGLIVSYLVSGTGLLLLALLLLKCQLDEGKVSAGILAVYVLSGLCGGIYMPGYSAERNSVRHRLPRTKPWVREGRQVSLRRRVSVRTAATPMASRVVKVGMS